MLPNRACYLRGEEIFSYDIFETVNFPGEPTARSQESRYPNCIKRAGLGVNPALTDGERHPVDGQHVGRDAVVHLMRPGVVHHGFE
jgi:hypothetical protein